MKGLHGKGWAEIPIKALLRNPWGDLSQASPDPTTRQATLVLAENITIPDILITVLNGTLFYYTLFERNYRLTYRCTEHNQDMCISLQQQQQQRQQQ